MGIVLNLVSLLACLQTVHLYPIQGERSSIFENYGMKLAKRPFYTYRDVLLSPFGFLDHPKVSQGQRKKAVDSTFIRFGRSSSPPKSGRNERSIDDLQQSLLEDTPTSSLESTRDLPEFKVQRFLLDHNGCRVRDSKELMRALLNDPNCIRAFQKAKKENVNDTFIRFGKREAPPEREFESVDSNEAR